ncbi:hypothetical protein GCM10025778_29810 [Paeniglutamicibacter antarcticus]|uniref:Uncharacterized protein n=1 Tax=Paeniglutamicibacter antarcticus TaxID=494023 RepID=A0ABP9TRX0_9MICC
MTPIASRRTIEVPPVPYFPAATLESWRAALAKNWMLSIVPGTSKPVARRRLLPVCSVSNAANAPALRWTSAAKASIALERFPGRSPEQIGRAALPAATASWMLAWNWVPVIIPVAGLISLTSAPRPRRY